MRPKQTETSCSWNQSRHKTARNWTRGALCAIFTRPTERQSSHFFQKVLAGSAGQALTQRRCPESAAGMPPARAAGGCCSKANTARPSFPRTLLWPQPLKPSCTQPNMNKKQLSFLPVQPTNNKPQTRSLI